MVHRVTEGGRVDHTRESGENVLDVQSMAQDLLLGGEVALFSRNDKHLTDSTAELTRERAPGDSIQCLLEHDRCSCRRPKKGRPAAYCVFKRIHTPFVPSETAPFLSCVFLVRAAEGGHGTHVAGAIAGAQSGDQAGDDESDGMAYQGKLAVFDFGESSTFNLLTTPDEVGFFVAVGLLL